MLSRQSLAAALVAGALTQAPQPAAPYVPGTPTGRVCALRDFGQPKPGVRGSIDPLNPVFYSRIVEGADSNLYGTSPEGGTFGKGTVFRFTLAGALTVLANFDGPHGQSPRGGLVDPRDGYLYGTTYVGGSLGFGTIFRVPVGGGQPKVLYSFRNGYTRGLKPPCKDGRCPFTPRQRADAAGSYVVAGLVPDGKGNFYGVTSYANNQQWGTLYQLRPPYDSTGFKTLCIFNPRLLADKDMAGFVCDKKLNLPGDLILGDGGKTLYGTTLGGFGAVYQATPAGQVSILHEFDYAQGAKPVSLMQASDGQLYGSAMDGGAARFGALWQLDPVTKAFRVMTPFWYKGFLAGAVPVSAPVEGKTNGKSDGFLYGVTKSGGRFGRGIVYKIPLKGSSQDLTVLHDFELYSTGRYLQVTPVQHSNGKFYGLAAQGGTYDYGTFYSLSGVDIPNPPLIPTVFIYGNPARDQSGVPLKDSIVTVRTDVWAEQKGVATEDSKHGISVTARCRNPHIVQFIYREKISPRGEHIPGSMTTSGGEYLLTTNPADPNWHTDHAQRVFLGEPFNPNAYLDQAPHTAHQNGPFLAAIWDKPNFPEIPFHAEDQAIGKPSQTWRAVVKDYVICNCQVARTVWWTTEMVLGKQTWKDIRIEQPAPDALDWINKQLAKDKYVPIP